MGGFDVPHLRSLAARGRVLRCRVCGAASRHGPRAADRRARRAAPGHRRAWRRAGQPARAARAHRDQRAQRAHVGRADLLQPERARARRRAAVPAAGRPGGGRHGDGRERHAARRGASRQGARRGGVRRRDARADRPCPAGADTGQQLQAARLPDPGARREGGGAALCRMAGDARRAQRVPPAARVCGPARAVLGIAACHRQRRPAEPGGTRARGAGVRRGRRRLPRRRRAP